MVSRRVDPAARRRCVNACDACKRRKERCDGSQPCGRCQERGVKDTCCFKLEPKPPRRRTRGVDASRRPSTSTSLSLDDGQSHDAASRSTWIEDGTDTATNATTDTSLTSQSPNSIGVDHSRFIQDRRGRYIFIGDSANLSFLHSVRCVARDALGSCPFVDDPLRSSIVEVCPDVTSKPFSVPGENDVPDLSIEQAEGLVKNFFAATQGAIDLFDEPEVISALPQLLSERSMTPLKATLFLILAIGAQMDPGMDSVADAYFSHGRFLGGQFLTEDVSMQSTQLSLLISIYLLGASRRNAAFVVLGQAVRSAHALGIHQRSNTALFSKAEFRERERLWRTIRFMDLFTSGSLGRPPSTTEDQAFGSKPCTEIDELYSILETILTDIYGQRKITADILAKVGSRQRRWAANFAHSSLATEPYKKGHAGTWPDIRSMHIRQTYYWTIMLLTRPFLVDRVAAHAKAVVLKPRQPIQACVQTEPSKTLIHACVDSAVKTVSLCEPLLTAEGLPAHSPVLINAVFHAAIILGFSYFGDLYTVFPLERALRKAHEILSLFPHDNIAMRYVAITQYLRDACSAYFERRHATSMDMESKAISRLFGQIHMEHPLKPRTQRNNQEKLYASEDSHGSRPPHHQKVTGTTTTEPDSYCTDDALDTFAFSSSDTCSENDLLAQLDLNLDFPVTTQHVWLDTDPFPINFAGMDMPSQSQGVPVPVPYM